GAYLLEAVARVEPAPLMSAGPGVHRLGVHEARELGFARLAHTIVTGIESEVTELVRIRVEIEELGRPVHMVNVLPATEPQHEHAPARENRGALPERGPGG